jgi:uncharacterized membrane protein YccC
VVILFNIIEPAGWKVGLTRIEDVAIGCGVSVLVGFLFWPRGATSALGRALSDAFVANSGYLVDSVDRLTNAFRTVDIVGSEEVSHAAFLRLEDAFRQFMAERGAKVVPVSTVANLVTGANRIRLAAFMLGQLSPSAPEPGSTELESVAIAGAVLRDSCEASHHWYEQFGQFLAEQRDNIDPAPSHDATLHKVLREAFDSVRRSDRANRMETVWQMQWADEVLEAQSNVEVDLADAATLFSRRKQHRILI